MNEVTIKTLNALLKIEHTAANLYATQSHCAAFAGYAKLAAKLAEEAEEERGHVAKLTERILFLGGSPVIAVALSSATADVQEMLEQGVELETDAQRGYREAITDFGSGSNSPGAPEGFEDHGTRIIIEGILKDTEDHLLWLQQQQDLIERLGLQNYLTTLV